MCRLVACWMLFKTMIRGSSVLRRGLLSMFVGLPNVNFKFLNYFTHSDGPIKGGSEVNGGSQDLKSPGKI